MCSCFVLGESDGYDHYLFAVYFAAYVTLSYFMVRKIKSVEIGIACFIMGIYDLCFALDSLLYGESGIYKPNTETWIYSNHEIFICVLHFVIMLLLIKKYNSVVGGTCYNIIMLFNRMLCRLAFYHSSKWKGGKEAER